MSQLGKDINPYYLIPGVAEKYELPLIGLGDFIELNSMSGTPRELFMNYSIEFAVVIGNHDYEAVTRKRLKKKGIREDFYSREISKQKIRKFNEDWFITQIDSIEDILEKRIYRTYEGPYAIYFMHIPPPKEMIYNILKEERGNRVLLLCGHVHEHTDVQVRPFYRGDSKAIEMILPTFKENKTMYKFSIDDKKITVTELQPRIVDKKEIVVKEIVKIGGENKIRDDRYVHYY